jgi:hypothetical protein
MKKILISLLFVSAFLMISCGDSDTGDTGNTGNTGNSGDTGNSGNTGNTGDTDNTDDAENSDSDIDEIPDDNTAEIETWTKQWGTSEGDSGQSVAVDSSGNIFVTGSTDGLLDGDANVGGSDIFLTKWNADGTIAWTKQWGTSENDYGISVAIDSSGSIFVTGSTGGLLDGDANVGGSDIFLTKWNADGTIAWTKQSGTSKDEQGQSIAIDGSGSIFVTGTTLGTFEGGKSAGATDIFLAKWNADGTKAWTQQWGTDDGDFGYSVAIDSSNNVFVTGCTYGSLDGNTSAGWLDIFLTKWNADGTKAWTEQWGTGNDEIGISVAIDSSDDIFVAGYTLGRLDGWTNNGIVDVFLSKWSADGTRDWTQQWGTSEEDYGISVAIDSSGNIFVTGCTLGSLNGETGAGLEDVFLTKWNADGTEAWTRQWGTSDDECGMSVALDSSGSIFITGYTLGSPDGNINAGMDDIFLIKVDNDGESLK